MKNGPIRIGMVAGEASGDILGAGLIEALRKTYPDAQFEGIGGPLMLEQGFKTFFPMERLSVMGLVEVLGRIFELIKIRRALRHHFLTNPPDVFIGIDAPDFTLGLEEQLRQQGIKTAHYVSPSVWAWRQRRVHKIARAVDLMLTLFPFEAKFYQNHQVPVAFVGHPLADMIPEVTDKIVYREKLQLESEGPLVALLPGSRSGEIHYLGELFIEAAQHMVQQNRSIQFVLPYVNEARKEQLEEILARVAPELPVTLVQGQSRDAMAAADAILLASGTATLEAMLLKRPMVVSYKISALTYFIVSRLVKISHIALPNLLAGRELVPELIQNQASPRALAREVLKRLSGEEEAHAMVEEFHRIHRELKKNASQQAALRVSQLIEGELTQQLQEKP